MRNIILFIFMFLSIGIKAQSYDDSNVHYYLPVGFSVENIYKNEPPSCIVIRGNSLDFYDLGDYGITQHLHNRKRFIEGIERKFQYHTATHFYDKKLSTYKYDVYTYNYGGNAFWGSGPYTSHIAVKKNKEELIKWKEGEENKKRYYFKISAEDFLPSDKTLDFLE